MSLSKARVLCGKLAPVGQAETGEGAADAVNVERVGEDAVSDAKRPRPFLAHADHDDLIALDLDAGRTTGDRGIGAEIVEDRGFGRPLAGDLAEGLADAESGSGAAETHKLAGIVACGPGAEPLGGDDVGERESGTLDLYEMHVGRIGDAGPGHGFLHGDGGQIDLALAPDILGPQVRREASPDGERLAHRLRAVLGDGEDHIMRREHALDAAGENERHAPPNRVRSVTRFFGDQQRQRLRDIASGVVVDEPVAMRLADHANDRGRIDRAVVDGKPEPGDIARVGKLEAEDVGAHRAAVYEDRGQISCHLR